MIVAATFAKPESDSETTEKTDTTAPESAEAS